METREKAGFLQANENTSPLKPELKHLWLKRRFCKFPFKVGRVWFKQMFFHPEESEKLLQEKEAAQKQAQEERDAKAKILNKRVKEEIQAGFWLRHPFSPVSQNDVLF